MDSKRITRKTIYNKDLKGKYVLYWMQQSQRIQYNQALIYAVESANQCGVPLCVYFGLTDEFPEANLRHYKFMLEGLKEVSEELERKHIGFILLHESPEKGIEALLKDACEIVMDQGYLRIQKEWYAKVVKDAINLKKSVIQVESDVVVPLAVVSDKMEYAARTIRPKIQKSISDFLETCKIPEIENVFTNNICPKELFETGRIILKLNAADGVNAVLDTLNIDTGVRPSHVFIGGETKAEEKLNDFIANKLEYYLESNSPAKDYCSYLSPYLHFGQISSVYIVLEIYRELQRRPQIIEAAESFLEQLVIRRELAMNFVNYNEFYDSFDHMTEQWAYDTMDECRSNPREYLYSLQELECGQTHDPYWNAAMYEMVQTGYMHNYMRMYWGKKIYEWSKTPKEAYETTVYLNNKYFLDGRDANSYTGIAWCYGKHDRAWSQRPIFGKLRFMNQKGLLRKFDMEQYLKKDKCLIGEYYQTENDFLF